MPYLPVLMALALIAVAGCAEEPKIDKPRSEMTQRERDSTVAISRLPGSQVVKQAMDVSDSEKARAAEFDSASDQ